MKKIVLLLTIMGTLMQVGWAQQRDRRTDLEIPCGFHIDVSSTGQLWIADRCGHIWVADSIGATWRTALLPDDEEFLSSPEKMKFKELDASFDKNKDTIIIIHGWLNDYKEAKRVCKEVIKPAREVFGNSNYVGFHWPSLDAWFGSAVRHADKAGKYLVHTLIHISKYIH